jgi:Flp pilus assembly protein TadG
VLNEATRIRWNQSTGQKELSTSQTVEGSTGYSTDSTNTATHGDSNEKADLNLKNKKDELSNAETKIVLPMSPFRPISSTITNTKIRKTKNMNPRNELLLSSILSTSKDI